MTAVAHAVPTLREELDRKTFETLEWLLLSVRDGRITGREFSVAVDTLFMAVSGLVSEEFMGLVTAAQGSAEDEKKPIKRHFHSPRSDTVVTVSWTPGENRLLTCKRESGLATGGGIASFDSAKKAMQAFEDYASGAVRKGWIEL